MLAVSTLAACASSKPKTEATNSSSESSSKVEKSSSKLEKSSSSSKETSSSVASTTNSQPLVTDEEMNSAQTIGDFKALYTKMIDSYLARVDAMAEKMPSSVRSGFETSISSMKETMEKAKTTFNDQLSAVGDDSTVVPEEARSTMIDTFKTARDGAQRMLESAEAQVQ